VKVFPKLDYPSAQKSSGYVAVIMLGIFVMNLATEQGVFDLTFLPDANGTMQLNLVQGKSNGLDHDRVGFH
jgi:hypothetical protein